jgi:hypothetical protein
MAVFSDAGLCGGSCVNSGVFCLFLSVGVVLV